MRLGGFYMLGTYEYVVALSHGRLTSFDEVLGPLLDAGQGRWPQNVAVCVAVCDDSLPFRMLPALISHLFARLSEARALHLPYSRW